MPDLSQLLARIHDTESRVTTLFPEPIDEAQSAARPADLMESVARLSSTIEALTPHGHRFRKLMAVQLDKKGPSHPSCIPVLLGILRALRSELQGGYFYSFSELIRADLMADHVEIAEHLLTEGHKDGAAVIAGGTLEAHLRKLSARHGIPLARSNGAPMLLSDMRRELGQRGLLSALDQRGLDSWILLRNQAAHGDYTQYNEQQVRSMIDGIRDFIQRMPA